MGKTMIIVFVSFLFSDQPNIDQWRQGVTFGQMAERAKMLGTGSEGIQQVKNETWNIRRVSQSDVASNASNQSWEISLWRLTNIHEFSWKFIEYVSKCKDGINKSQPPRNTQFNNKIRGTTGYLEFWLWYRRTLAVSPQILHHLDYLDHLDIFFAKPLYLSQVPVVVDDHPVVEVWITWASAGWYAKWWTLLDLFMGAPSLWDP